MVAKFFYYVNLLLTVLYTAILIIVEKRIKYSSFSFVLLVIYGFLAIWVIVFDMILVVIFNTDRFLGKSISQYGATD